MNKRANITPGVFITETPVPSPKILRRTKFTSLAKEAQDTNPEENNSLTFDGYDMVAIFQTNNTGITRLYNDRNKGITEISIDNKPIDLATGYTFTDNKEHIVRYKFTDSKYLNSFSFSACTEMRSFKLSENVEYIQMYAFEGSRGLKDVILPDSIKGIGQYAFYYCKGLENVILGPNVGSIGDYCFDQDSALKTITCKAVIAPKLVYNVFNFVGKNGILYYPAGSDYSSWLSKSVGYLGGHGWTGVEIKD